MNYFPVIGCVLALLGTLTTNLGMNLQKYSTLSETNHPRSLWWIGFICIALTQILDFVALGLTTQTIVSTINALGISTNIGWGYYFFKRPPERLQYLGIIIIIGADIIIVLNADNQTHEVTIASIFVLIQNISFVIYILLMMMIAWAIRHKSSMVSGVLSAQAFVCSKLIAGLTLTTIQSDNQIVHPFFWLLVILLAVIIYFQQTTYQHMLKNSDHSEITTFSSVFILISVIASFCVFEEYSYISVTSSAVIWIAVMILIVGIALIRSTVNTEQCQSEAQMEVSQSEVQMETSKVAINIQDFGDSYVESNVV